jgi:hypothetical protein
MQGLSERKYAARAGLSRGAIQKARAAGRLVLFGDGSIDAGASDQKRAAMTDPSKQRAAAKGKLKPVPAAAVSAVGETLREQGLRAPVTGGSTTFLQAKTANEVLKTQERRLKLQKMKGELVDRARATTLVFRLAREERDAWINWPARAAALSAGGRDVTLETSLMQKTLQTHVRAQLEELGGSARSGGSATTGGHVRFDLT